MEGRAILERHSVSRETIQKLELFRKLLERWNRSINLVSKESIDRYWDRHVSDSLGLVADIDWPATWLDLGSGGGFPVVPIAIQSKTEGRSTRFVSIESDTRKAAFLKEVARELGLDLHVAPKRIEDIPPVDAEIVSARALASLSRLLCYAERHCAENGVLLFLKGERLHEELTEAAKVWHFNYQHRPHPLTDRGNILRIDSFGRS